MNLTKKRWIYLVLCCLINLCLGSIYAWSVFATPMAEHLTQFAHHTLTTGDLAIVYTIANAVGPITMISGGFFNDKFGPKAVIFTGGLMFGLGLIASGFVHSVGMLVLTYGIISGLGLGMAYGSTISTAVKFFQDKRGLIGGITTGIYGLSSVILPPVVTAIVAATDVTMAFKIIGIVFLVIVCGSALFLKPCPDDFVPEGWTPPVNVKSSAHDKNWKEMLKTPIFYIMILTLTCGAFSGMMIISQASGVAMNMIGMVPASAALAVSVLALFNVLGRIAAGFISDRIGRINTLAGALVLSMFGLGALYLCHQGTVALFYLGIAVVGICFGSFMGVFPGFTVDRFGAKNNSVNYGIMFIGFALAGYFGPSVMRSIFAADGAYQRAFLIALVFDIAGIILTFLYRVVLNKTEGGNH